MYRITYADGEEQTAASLREVAEKVNATYPGSNGRIRESDNTVIEGDQITGEILASYEEIE